MNVTTDIFQVSPASLQNSPALPSTSYVPTTPVYTKNLVLGSPTQITTPADSSEAQTSIDFTIKKINELKDAAIVTKENSEKSLNRLQRLYKPILWTTGCLALALAVGVAVAAVFFWAVTPLVICLLGVGAVASIALTIFTIIHAIKFPVLKNTFEDRIYVSGLLSDNEGCADYVVQKLALTEQSHPITDNTHMFTYLQICIANIKQAADEFVDQTLLSDIESIKQSLYTQIETDQKEINRIKGILNLTIKSTPQKGKNPSTTTQQATEAQADLKLDQEHLNHLKEFLDEPIPPNRARALRKKLLKFLIDQPRTLQEFQKARTLITKNLNKQRKVQKK